MELTYRYPRPACEAPDRPAWPSCGGAGKPGHGASPLPTNRDEPRSRMVPTTLGQKLIPWNCWSSVTTGAWAVPTDPVAGLTCFPPALCSALPGRVTITSLCGPSGPSRGRGSVMSWHSHRISRVSSSISTQTTNHRPHREMHRAARPPPRPRRRRRPDLLELT